MNADLAQPWSALDMARRQLAEIKGLHDAGVLSGPSYEESRSTLERRIIDIVLGGAFDSASPASTGAPVAVPVPAPAPRRPASSWKLSAGLAASVLAVALAGYFGSGATANRWSGGPSAVAEATSSPPPHATNVEQISAMADKLAGRLKDNPQDPDGWAMLGRSYTVLGRHAEAVAAFEKAEAQREADADLLADHADALALVRDRVLDGEPMKLVGRALQIDPRNLKALSLAGTQAFDAKNYPAAAKFWEQMVQIGPASHPLVEQAQAGLGQARELSGLPLAQVAKSGVGLRTVSGTVRLAPGLQSQVGPEDTVFVFARPASGSRIPVAIMRKKVKDLPLQFVLDDGLAMSPDALLSKAGKVVVAARISKSGNAAPQKGDLSGQSGTVDVGAAAVAVVIGEAVQ
jgi:cytochrome c-type biogenesis protein CcmH